MGGDIRVRDELTFEEVNIRMRQLMCEIRLPS